MTRRTSRYGVAAGAVVAALTLVTGPSAHAGDAWLLPDLRQGPVGCPGGFAGDPAACTDWDVCMVADAAAPSGECLAAGPAEAVRLRFTSSEDNVGDGPLLLYGSRPDRRQPTMTMRQGFQTATIPDTYAAAQRSTATTSYYEPAKSHQHWHLMGFEYFQLRTPAGGTVVRDRKNGFCLGDRYDTSDAARLPATPRDPDTDTGALARFLRGNMCGHHQPLALEVVHGISVGRGDDYRLDVDFQWLDLTGVPSGVYDVVNTVNEDRTLLEKDYTNNSSSIAISLRWPGGAGAAPEVIGAPPVVELLRSCPGRVRCAAPAA